MIRTFGFLLCCLVLLSCREDYYTTEDYKSVRKIDTHVHLNSESPALTELAREDNFFLLTINVDAPSRSLDDQYRFALHQVKQSPERVKFLSTFDLKNWGSSGWAIGTIGHLAKSFEDGALGIKIWKNIGMVHRDSAGNFVMIDDPKFDPVINYVIEQDKTVLGHLGEPRNCWLPIEQMTVNNDRNYFKNHPEYHMFLHPDYPSYDDQINARDRLLERHPDMRFVGAHLGSLEWDVDELAKRLDRFPNMAVDMAARICHLQHQTIADREKIRNFFITYQDRLIYATDAGINSSSDAAASKKDLHERWLADWKYFVTDETLSASEVNGDFRGLRLPREVVDKIYRLNAMRWYKIADYDH